MILHRRPCGIVHPFQKGRFAMKGRVLALRLGQGALAGVFLLLASICFAGSVENVNVSSTGEPGNGVAGGGSATSDGRFVAFYSFSTNLVPNDTNGHEDIFVRDRKLGITERVSIADDGTQANDWSWVNNGSVISEDGRFVVFSSNANNLVPGDIGGDDVFVYDRQEQKIECISKLDTTNYSGGAAISADGRYVVFISADDYVTGSGGNVGYQVYVRDRKLGTTALASKSISGGFGNGQSVFVTINADGRKVAFVTYASNLVEDDTNPGTDAFWHDLDTGETIRVSVANGSTYGWANVDPIFISSDGNFVSFRTTAALDPADTNGLADIYLYDIGGRRVDRVSLDTNGNQFQTGYHTSGGSITSGGRKVLFANWKSHYVRDIEMGITNYHVGGSGEGAFSRYGEYITFKGYIYDPTTCP